MVSIQLLHLRKVIILYRENVLRVTDNHLFIIVNRVIFVYYTLMYQCSKATTTLGWARSNINTKHNKYNRHATTNQIILSLVNEVKEKIYLK